MPPLNDVTTMITAARSRKIRFTMIIQNFAQLDQVYGKENAETIKGNCGNIIYLITTELKALEEISKMCGEVKSKKDDKTASTPLVTVSDLQRMKQFEVIIMRMRKLPFKTKFTPYFKLDWGKKYPPSKYPTRPKREVHTFDIKEFVKGEKKRKLLEMMNAVDEEESTKTVALNEEESAPRVVPFNKVPDEDFNDFLSHKGYGNFARTSNEANKEFNNPVQESSKDEEDDDLGFDVDELVKKIDAKIAELEEEERKEKEAEEQKKQENASLNSNIKTINPEPKIEAIPEMSDYNKTNINLNDELDDDDFFDDFFDN